MDSDLADNLAKRLRHLQQWAKLRQNQFYEAIRLTTDTATDFLRRQVQRGNWREVQELLHGKPLTGAGKLLWHEMRGRVVGKLILRLGLRKAVAAALVLMLLPLVLAQIAGSVMGRLRSQDSQQ